MTQEQPGTRSAGLNTIVLPWQSAGAIFQDGMAIGKFHGVMMPTTPTGSRVIVDILARAGLPKGVLNLVMGRGSVVGEAILNSTDVSAVTFTGSVQTGRKIAQACVLSNPMKKFQLEMGGKNPLVVLDDADLKTAVEVAVNGAYFSTGQRCTASSRLVVTEGIHDRFVAALKERLDKLVIGDALDAKTQIGPVVDASQLKQDEDYLSLIHI